jgi:hypothetical protein
MSGFHELLNVNPSSLLILFVWSSSSMASLIRRSWYPVFWANTFVSWDLILRSKFMLCCAIADLSGILVGNNRSFRESFWLRLEGRISWFRRNSPTRARAASFLKFLDNIHNGTLQSVGLLWTGDRPVSETSTWQNNTHETSMSPAGFEPAVAASERPQTPPTPFRPRSQWARRMIIIPVWRWL